jgi:hypothetical protein
MSPGAILVTLSLALAAAAWIGRPLLRGRRQRRADIESWVAQVRRGQDDQGTAPADGPRFCTRCGQQAREGDRYCSACGAQLDEAAP